ncbi:MAG TPA: NAD-dependent epimerase/dehydratase family protein [Pyrinomonadaceae bacterium]
MKIIVFGASGFIGSAVSAHLSDEGHEVIRAVGPRSETHEESFPIDISDFRSFPELRDLDAVVNCAGIAHRFGRVSADEFDRVNAQGARNVARFAVESEAKTLVHISSVLVYGNRASPDPIDEHCEPRPEDEYAQSKLLGEQAASDLCSDQNIRLVILRPAPVIGEGSRGNVRRLIRAIDRRRFIWLGEGSNRKSLVYVGDVARAVARSLEVSASESRFNLVTGTTTMKHIVSVIADRLGKNIPTFTIPGTIGHAAGLGAAAASFLITGLDRNRRTLESWLSDDVYSGDAFSTRFQFVPGTGIDDALRREVDDYLRNK